MSRGEYIANITKRCAYQTYHCIRVRLPLATNYSYSYSIRRLHSASHYLTTSKQKSNDVDDSKTLSSHGTILASSPPSSTPSSTPSSSSSSIPAYRTSPSGAAEKTMSVRPWSLHQTMRMMQRFHQLLSNILPKDGDLSQALPPLPSSWQEMYDRDVKRNQLLEAAAVVCRAQLQQDLKLRHSGLNANDKVPGGELTSDQAANLTMTQLKRMFPRQLRPSRADRLEVATYREDVVIPFSRQLRRLQQKLVLLEGGAKKSFTKLMGDTDVDELFGHSLAECKIHFEILCDERTMVKHRVDRVNPDMDNARFAYAATNIKQSTNVEDGDGQTSSSSSLPSSSSDPFSFRSLLRYIFLHRLGPLRQGTWKDVSREVEALAQNVDQVTAGREKRVLESDSSASKLDSSLSAASDDAITELGPLYSLIQPPAPYILPLANAQGVHQGRLYERSIRATLSRYDEFQVVRRESKSRTERIVSIYELNLRKLRMSMNEAMQRKERMIINRLAKKSQPIDSKVAFFKRRGRKLKTEAASRAL